MSCKQKGWVSRQHNRVGPCEDLRVSSLPDKIGHVVRGRRPLSTSEGLGRPEFSKMILSTDSRSLKYLLPETNPLVSVIRNATRWSVDP